MTRLAAPGLLAPLLLILACSGDPQPPAPRPEQGALATPENQTSTEEADHLAPGATGLPVEPPPPESPPAAPSPQVAALEAELAGLPPGGEEAIALRLDLARELLAGGDAGGALAAAQQALAEQRRLWNADTVAGIVSPGSHRQGDWLPAPLLLIVQAAESLAMQGECVARQRPAGCILPLSRAGVHADTAPASTAMSYALELLDLRPNDPLPRWLLNVAAAQAGATGRVPARWRASAGTLLAAPDDPPAGGAPWLVPRPGTTIPTGLLPDPAGANPGLDPGIAWSARADLDADGQVEVITSGPEGVRLYREAQGAGQVEVTPDSGLAGPRPAGPGCLLDADGDGLEDLLITSREASPAQVAAALLGPGPGAPAGAPQLYRNRGDLRFQDLTASAGLGGAHLAGAVVCADLDGDGADDIFLTPGYGEPGLALPARLLLNDGSGAFRDATAGAGAGLLLSAARAGAADLDGDGDQDLVLALDGPGAGPSTLTLVLENRGPSGVPALP